MSQIAKERKYFPDYPDVVSVAEVCTMLRLGRNSVYTLLKSGEIRSVRVGTKYIIPRKSVTRFIKNKD